MIVHLSIAKENASQGVSTVVSQFEKKCFMDSGHVTIRPKKNDKTIISSPLPQKKSILQIIKSKLKSKKIIYFFSMLFSAKILVLKNKKNIKNTDFIICHDVFTLFFSFIHLSKINKICLYNHSDSSPFETLKKNYNSKACVFLIKIIEKITLSRNIHSVYSLSEFSSEFMQNKVKNKNCKFKVVNNFIVASKEVKPINHKNPSIYLIGTVCHRKRQIEFFNAISKVNHPLLQSYKFNVLGDATSDNIIKMKNFNFVNYIGNVDNINNYVKYADILLSVSSDEGLPMSMIETISNGGTIISTDVGGCNKICLNEINGFIIPVSFEKTFSILETIHNLCLNDTLRYKFSEASLKLFNECFSENYALNFWNNELSYANE